MAFEGAEVGIAATESAEVLGAGVELVAENTALMAAEQTAAVTLSESAIIGEETLAVAMEGGEVSAEAGGT